MVNIRIDELNMPAEPQDNKWKQYSNGHNTLTLDKDGFTLSTLFPHSAHTWKGRKERAALMENRVFIALFSKPTYLFNNCKSIAELQLYWHQLTEDYPYMSVTNRSLFKIVLSWKLLSQKPKIAIQNILLQMKKLPLELSDRTAPGNIWKESYWMNNTEE